MHTWDVMPSTNYDHNWYGGIQIKSENQEIIAAYQQHQSHSQSHPSTMDSSSSPGTSPQSMDTDSGLYFESTNRPLGFNPLTPPGYPTAILSSSQHHIRNGSSSHNPNTPCKIFPKIESTYNAQTTLTPSHTPPIDVTPPKSPKMIDETPEKDIESISDNYMDSCDETRSLESDYEEDCIKPVSSKSGSNKPKKYKCKQCDHISVTKTTFWEHVKGHIKPEKMLKCPKCPFVTEYKHHLEYHLRNHDGSKPFQCPNCNYSCVNKSMLNSHLKSHSNIYQYRCSDCNYATKYCHSLKLHLRKYNHKPAMVLNQDGTPNPLPIIDVYGTRRGPKTRSTRQRQTQHQKQQQHILQQQQQLVAAQQAQQIEEPTQSTQIVTPKMQPHDLEAQHQHQQHQAQTQQQIPNLISSMLPNSLANMLHAGSNVPSMFPYLNLNLHMLAVRQQQNLLSQLSPNVQEAALHSSSQDLDDELKRRNGLNNSNNSNNNNSNILPIRSSALDLTQPENTNNQHHHHHHNHKMYSEVIHDDVEHECDDEDDEIMPTSTSCPQPGNITPTTPLISGGKNRRKGRAFKLEMIKDGSESDDDSNNKKNINNNNNNNNNDNSSNNDIHNECTEINVKSGASPSPPPPTPGAATSQTITQQHAAQKTAEPSKSYDCKFCDISFKDAVLYTIHMGYHGYNDVFKCNMCGEKCDDRIAFFLHIARNPHS